MRIVKAIYDRLLSLPSAPPETGGILGGCGGMISELFLDNVSSLYYRAIYMPNTKLLNTQIHQWNQAGISFMGVFHTHPDWEPELSQADKDYIQHIMSAMPSNIKRLEFPLVLPGKTIKWYAGKRIGSTFDIQLAHIQIQQ